MDDRDQDEPEDEFYEEPVTERVRIIGAQPAGVMAGQDHAPDEDGPDGPDAEGGPGGQGALEFDAPGGGPGAEGGAAGAAVGPLDADRAGRSAPSGRNGGDPLAHAPATAEGPAVPDMPHWTDPPTGQVPAVLDRRGEDDDEQWSARGDTGPAWREHQHEWDDSGFDPSLLADDETRVGALEETPVEERRPWEFDDFDTGRTPAVRHDEPEERVTAPATVRPEERRSDAGTTFHPETPAAAAAAVAEIEVGVESERGVASISSSPLRLGGRDHGLGAAPPAARGGLLRSGPRPPAPDGEGPGRDVPVAIATGLGVALLAVVCFELGTVATVALTTVVVGLAAAEFNKALRRAKRRPAALVLLVATVGTMIAAYVKGPTAVPFVVALTVMTTMVWYLVGTDRGSAVEGMAVTLFGYVWIGVLGSFAALMLAPSQYPHRHGVAFMLGVVVACVGADVGALAVGSWLGRHPMAPTVSPRKTWQGFVGGAVLAVALSAAVTGQVHPWTVEKAALLGLVAAVVAGTRPRTSSTDLASPTTTTWGWNSFACSTRTSTDRCTARA
ncbi:MAG TPA: phosphatidate cytidylyltransferase [Acidimicrobiales bacterium]|nr:phosphatidate cytidylyltransferase [Acidimicrobiales bacterium]